MSKFFDLITKAIEHDGEWYYFSCGESRAWYQTQDGKLLELPRESGLGYDSLMASGADLDLAINRLDDMVDDAVETGRLAKSKSDNNPEAIKDIKEVEG